MNGCLPRRVAAPDDEDLPTRERHVRSRMAAPAEQLDTVVGVARVQRVGYAVARARAFRSSKARGDHRVGDHGDLATARCVRPSLFVEELGDRCGGRARRGLSGCTANPTNPYSRGSFRPHVVFRLFRDNENRAAPQAVGVSRRVALARENWLRRLPEWGRGASGPTGDLAEAFASWTPARELIHEKPLLARCAERRGSRPLNFYSDEGFTLRAVGTTR